VHGDYSEEVRGGCLLLRLHLPLHCGTVALDGDGNKHAMGFTVREQG
jgi:hypothetical protein